ncbi:MAG: alpha/beta hydrolase [Calditrichaeota bacterium]|nr:alpha/beta hydrolase [Calditrichota bacterium]
MNLEIISEEAVSNARPTPILFLHGMWHAAWCWAEHFMPYFAQQGYVSYALSLRGHGGSEGRERLRWTSLADYVADVTQVVNQMEKPPVLIGHSMGGLIVQKYLESNEVPAAVLLASVPPKGVILATLRVASRHPMAFMKANLTLSMFPVVSTPQLTREAFFSADMPEEKVRHYFSRLQDESYRAYLDTMGLNLPRPKRVKTPLLVLGAANDALFSPREVEATGRAYNTRAEIFPNMAHDMMLEDGWQRAADRILGWLNERGL